MRGKVRRRVFLESEFRIEIYLPYLCAQRKDKLAHLRRQRPGSGGPPNPSC